MLKLLVCLLTIASGLFSVCAPEIRSSQDTSNQSSQWNSCKWPVLGNGVVHSYAEGGKVRLGWHTSQANAEVRSNQHTQESSVFLAFAVLSDHQEYQEDTLVENKWSSRSLCAVLKSENVPEDYTRGRKDAKHAEKRTLLDQEDLFSWRDMMESSAPVTHIRVKRQKEEVEVPLRNRHSKYLQQLADSFPQDADKQMNVLSTTSSLSESVNDYFTEPDCSSKGDRIVRSVQHVLNRENTKHSHSLVGKNPRKVVARKKKRGHVGKVYKKHRKPKKGVSRTTKTRKNRSRHSHRINLHDSSNEHAEERRLGNKIARLREEVTESIGSRMNARMSSSTAADNLSESIELRVKRNQEDGEDSLRNKRENSVEQYKTNEGPAASNELFPGQKTYQSSNDNTQYNNQALESAQEVEHLAKELVAKVGVLESYLHYDAITSNERTPDIPAIDDLCSNVTVSYVPKEQPKAVNECETTPLPIETKVAIKRNASPKKKGGKKLTRKKSTKTRNDPTKHSSHANKRREASKAERKWGRWTDWSSCSVSCGKGRQIRWRYCLHDCEAAEIEMDEKACQLPACPPGKFLGIF